MSDAQKLTEKLIAAGADRAKVIAIIDGYGDPVDWNYHSLNSIIAEVWLDHQRNLPIIQRNRGDGIMRKPMRLQLRKRKIIKRS